MKITPALQKIYNHRREFNGSAKRILCKLQSCDVYLFETADGKPAARGYKGRAYKPTFVYRFRDVGKRAEFLGRWMKENYDQAQLKATQIFSNKTRSLKIGDVLCASWGYEQTNIDYYMVVKLVGKVSVDIVQIGKQKLEDGPQSMTGRCVPDKSVTFGDVMRKKPDGDGIKIASYCWAKLIKPEVVAGVEVYASASWSSYA